MQEIPKTIAEFQLRNLKMKSEEIDKNIDAGNYSKSGIQPEAYTSRPNPHSY